MWTAARVRCSKATVQLEPTLTRQQVITTHSRQDSEPLDTTHPQHHVHQLEGGDQDEPI